MAGLRPATRKIIVASCNFPSLQSWMIDRMTFDLSTPFAEQYPSSTAVSSVVASHRISGIYRYPKKIPAPPRLAGRVNPAAAREGRRPLAGGEGCARMSGGLFLGVVHNRFIEAFYFLAG